ncbi:hypothetical protein VTI74DRAFT_10945 [Chaetomium olivicolor]
MIESPQMMPTQASTHDVLSAQSNVPIAAASCTCTTLVRRTISPLAVRGRRGWAGAGYLRILIPRLQISTVTRRGQSTSSLKGASCARGSSVSGLRPERLTSLDRRVASGCLPRSVCFRFLLLSNEPTKPSSRHSSPGHRPPSSPRLRRSGPKGPHASAIGGATLLEDRLLHPSIPADDGRLIATACLGKTTKR